MPPLLTGLPPPTNPPLPLHEYKLLSFDVYGTLIEYKSHILDSFSPLLSRLPSASPYLDPTPSSTTIPKAVSKGSIEFLKLFQRHEDAIKLEDTGQQFDELLVEIWIRIARALDVKTTQVEAQKFGSKENIASWPCFPGTVDALVRLSKRFDLVALSNIDRFAWDVTSSTSDGLGEVPWTKIFTAEDFGNDVKHADREKLKTLLEYIETKGIEKTEILHVAQSLGHDQIPAKELGISSVWLVGDGPRFGKQDESKKALDRGVVGYMLRFEDLRAFADYVDRNYGDDGEKREMKGMVKSFGGDM